MATSPAAAPMSGAMPSPTDTGIDHQPSAHALTPRVAHCSAYSASRAGTPRGIAPSELLTRYVELARMGNSSRKRRSGSVTGWRPGETESVETKRPDRHGESAGYRKS